MDVVEAVVPVVDEVAADQPPSSTVPAVAPVAVPVEPTATGVIPAVAALGTGTVQGDLAGWARSEVEAARR